MLLSAGAFSEFAKFMQISLLIVLPILVTTVAIVSIIHLRKKKKKNRSLLKEEGKDPIAQLIDSTPDDLNYEDEEADYVQYDQSALVSAYKNKLVYSHARYTAIQRDYKKIKEDYHSLLLDQEKKSSPSKKINMEPLTPITEEKKELQNKLEQLNISFQNLERENVSLTNQLGLLTGSDEEKAAIVNRWRNETTPLLDKIAEQEYLKDIVEEKKMQIEFLQQQLEQRIQKFHQSEKHAIELTSQLEDLQESMATSGQHLQMAQSELSKKNEEFADLQKQLNEKDEMLTQKINTITWLENSLQEIKQQNEILNAMSADNTDKVADLQELLNSKESKLIQIEQKLKSNKKMLSRLHQEITNCIEPDETESLVIGLKPVYATDEKSEWPGM